MSGSYLVAARSFSTITCGLLCGSTAWAVVGVFPALIDADLPSPGKLTVFSDLTQRSRQFLPPLFLGAMGALGFLVYRTNAARTAYTIALGSVVAAFGAQIGITPRFRRIQEQLSTGEASKEHRNGEIANKAISGILPFMWTRIFLLSIAIGALTSAAVESTVPNALGSVVKPVMAAARLEYGLE